MCIYINMEVFVFIRRISTLISIMICDATATISIATIVCNYYLYKAPRRTAPGSTAAAVSLGGGPIA